jgi:hypothetical protein
MLSGSHLHEPHVMIAVVARRERLSADTDNFALLRVVLRMHDQACFGPPANILPFSARLPTVSAIVFRSSM